MQSSDLWGIETDEGRAFGIDPMAQTGEVLSEGASLQFVLMVIKVTEHQFPVRSVFFLRICLEVVRLLTF
jgi:hypothetical protein